MIDGIGRFFAILALCGWLAQAGPAQAGPVQAGPARVVLDQAVPQGSPSSPGSEKWLGTDDLVDRKMAEVAGVRAKRPLLDLSQGNLDLFIFTTGGFLAGAVFGYYWRQIFKEKVGRQDG